MPRYNVMGIARTAIPKESLKAVMKQVSAFVIEGGGLLESIDNYGVKQLPYKIGQPMGQEPRARIV